MKEMTRLKTTTTKGKVFLSPFVFDEEEAVRRIEKPKLKESKETKTEAIKVLKYPGGAIWSVEKFGKEKMTIERLISRVRMLKAQWEVMEDANN